MMVAFCHRHISSTDITFNKNVLSMSLNKVYTDKPNHVKPTETLIVC